MLCLFSLSLALGVALPSAHKAHLAEATRAFYRGDNAAAAKEARQYLLTHPNAAVAHILPARTLLTKDDNQGAYQELLKVLRSEPKNIDALYWLARACTNPGGSYLAEGVKAKSAEEYEAALRINPQGAEILDDLGALKRSDGHCEEAANYDASVRHMSRGIQSGAKSPKRR
jgi:predicted Zn-dependent protease